MLADPAVHMKLVCIMREKNKNKNKNSKKFGDFRVNESNPNTGGFFPLTRPSISLSQYQQSASFCHHSRLNFHWNSWLLKKKKKRKWQRWKLLPRNYQQWKTRRVIPKSRTFQLKMASWILLLMGSKSQTAYQEHRPDQSFDIRTRSILMFCFIRHPGIKTEMADV